MNKQSSLGSIILIQTVPYVHYCTVRTWKLLALLFCSLLHTCIRTGGTTEPVGVLCGPARKSSHQLQKNLARLFTQLLNFQFIKNKNSKILYFLNFIIFNFKFDFFPKGRFFEWTQKIFRFSTTMTAQKLYGITFLKPHFNEAPPNTSILPRTNTPSRLKPLTGWYAI